jgi:beta-phosphoglucomutase-like phosphatase (HAD superfamily)
MGYVIFDLDGTVIDSSHRQNTLPDGSLDLEHWLENNTHEKIMRDSLLPLADSMKSIFKAGHTVVICTARSPHESNHHFLRENDLPHHVFLSRGNNDMRGDAELKIDLLTDYFNSEGFSSVADAGAVMFDDNLKVIAAMLSIGIHCINATKQNAKMAA